MAEQTKMDLPSGGALPKASGVGRELSSSMKFAFMLADVDAGTKKKTIVDEWKQESATG